MLTSDLIRRLEVVRSILAVRLDEDRSRGLDVHDDGEDLDRLGDRSYIKFLEAGLQVLRELDDRLKHLSDSESVVGALKPIHEKLLQVVNTAMQQLALRIRRDLDEASTLASVVQRTQDKVAAVKTQLQKRKDLAACLEKTKKDSEQFQELGVLAQFLLNIAAT